MISNIQKIWDDSRSAGTLSTAMEVLLGAFIWFNFDKEMVYRIKDQVFQYIRSSDRLPLSSPEVFDYLVFQFSCSKLKRGREWEKSYKKIGIEQT